jgi:hypothetical protein|tara:strand:- start:272 stop:643 length:372 start_codon:yes stop_codon:yes gene_type:complete
MRAEFKVSLKRTKHNYIRRDRNRLHKEPILRQYLALAHQVKKVLKAQPKRTLKEISGWIGYTPARMSQIVSLLFLSPLIQEEILLSSKSSLHQLSINIAHKISQELSWDKQNELWIQARDKER